MKMLFVRAGKIYEDLCFCFFVFVILITFGALLSRSGAAVRAMGPVAEKTVVVDPGHGGYDPGKAGVKGEDEKDINLKIAKKLASYLEQGGAEAIITRTDDKALDITKKDDMKKRVKTANSSDADIFISIHQNAFTSGSPHGAQVFYHEGSEDGVFLAGCIQNRLKEVADNDNTREIKPNLDYYILKKTEIPAVIVECGFLSNSKEEERLNTAEYQDLLAWAIYMGIADYFDMRV